jgi:hypothetical protein
MTVGLNSSLSLGYLSFDIAEDDRARAVGWGGDVAGALGRGDNIADDLAEVGGVAVSHVQ